MWNYHRRNLTDTKFLLECFQGTVFAGLVFSDYVLEQLGDYFPPSMILMSCSLCHTVVKYLTIISRLGCPWLCDYQA